jgi:hypothetical protein
MAANEFADRSCISVLVLRKCALRRMPILAVLRLALSTIIILLDPEVSRCFTPENLTFDAVGACYVSQGSRVSDRKMAANEFADRS